MPGPSQPGGQLAGPASGRQTRPHAPAAGPGRVAAAPMTGSPPAPAVGARTRRRSPTNASR
eukprot:2383656-Prymnesium_polylepis.1